MEKGTIEVYCGNGKGKTTLALGESIKASLRGESVIIIQFLKGNERREWDFLEELEDTDIRIFRFERSDKCYLDLNEQEREDQKLNILNGINYARKVISTEGCDFLVLDEILRLVDYDIIDSEQIIELLEAKGEGMEILLTGRALDEKLRAHVDSITTIETEQVRETQSES